MTNDLHLAKLRARAAGATARYEATRENWYGSDEERELAGSLYAEATAELAAYEAEIQAERVALERCAAALQKIVTTWDDNMDGEQDADGYYRCSSAVLHSDIEEARAALRATEAKP